MIKLIIIAICALLISCQKSDINPDFKIDKGKADSIYSVKFIDNKLK